MVKVNPKQERFAVALMSTSTITEAYTMAKITNSTAHKYLNDPDFQRVLYATKTRSNGPGNQ